MAILFSISFDKTTDSILDWLHFYKQSFTRINEINDYKGKINLSSSYFHSTDQKKEKVYLRKFNLLENQGRVSSSAVNAQMDGHLRTEYMNLYEILCDAFDPKKTLGLSINRKWNKLIILRHAFQAGLDIPFSCVTNSKKEILELFSNYPQLITKPIDDISYFNINQKTWIPYTSIITKQYVESIPEETIFPSLVQEYIDKEYEIRVFYLDGQCYSMAIFSQVDEQTTIDFRKYNKSNPNRNVPYLLPEELQVTIKAFMQKLELNTGSLDFIRSKDGRYVFLEVNPAGQYQMVSQRCNYKLEKKIAEWLSNE
jgi:ATP-GRASP peptide maturase of grasp-with-spasm system